MSLTTQPRNVLCERLAGVQREIDEIERQMHEEAGMLSGDPRVLRLRSLWKEADDLEDAIYDADGWR